MDTYAIGLLRWFSTYHFAECGEDIGCVGEMEAMTAQGQRQDGTLDQMRTVYDLANKAGCCDAADAIMLVFFGKVSALGATHQAALDAVWDKAIEAAIRVAFSFGSKKMVDRTPQEMTATGLCDAIESKIRALKRSKGI